MPSRKQPSRKAKSEAKRAPGFPFLELPLEIRNRIYRLLLANPSVFEIRTEEKVNTYLKLHPAILLANKGIYKEAENILKYYRQNELIVLKIGTHNLINGSVYQIQWNRIPAFRFLAESDVADPVLNITIKPLEEMRNGPEKFKTLITTTKDTPFILKAIWQAAKTCNFYRTSGLALRFHNQISFRRAALSNSVLKPWGDVQGFKEVILMGNMDENIIQYLNDRNSKGFRLNDVVRTLEGFSSRAEVLFDRKQYQRAAFAWDHMQAYWEYQFDLLIDPNARPIKSDSTVAEALECTLPLLVRKIWGKLKCDLHVRLAKNWCAKFSDAQPERKKFESDVRYSRKAVYFVKDLIETYTLRYCMAPALEARLYICSAMAYWACGDHDAARDVLYISIPALLGKNNLFTDRSSRLYNSLEIGIDRYLKSHPSCYFWNGQDILHDYDVDKYLQSICSSFWSWLGLPDGPGWPLVDLQTLVIESWKQLQEDIQDQVIRKGRADYTRAVITSGEGIDLIRRVNLIRILVKPYELEYHIAPVLEAKFYICNAMAKWACGNYDEARNVLHTVLPALLASNSLFMEVHMELPDGLEKGINRYLKPLKKQPPKPKYIATESEIQKSQAVDKGLRLVCRPFWEWLGLPDGPAWPIY